MSRSDVRDSVPPLASAAGVAGRARRRGGVIVALGCTAIVASALEAAPAEPVGRRAGAPAVLVGPLASLPSPRRSAASEDDEPTTLVTQRERLFARMHDELGLAASQMAQVRAVFASSAILGQGNPAVSRHPMTRTACARIRADAEVHPARIAACGAPNMVPLYAADEGETPADAHVCIDQLEFPDIPCEYPVVQVRAIEAAELCRAVGKRLCDAHEWEGACAGSLRAPEREYRWGWPRDQASYAHNVKRDQVWAYGPSQDNARCATASTITRGCEGGGWRSCGSNTYPTGAFPGCQSPFGVFDQHGNAAEHMNLPTRPEELASRGGDGFTEMKGSWFAFGASGPYDDDCRYRAPAWHETEIANPKSHMNYHLGFRCCKDVDPPGSAEASSRRRPLGEREGGVAPSNGTKAARGAR